MIIKCILRSIYYWFKYPNGYRVSGHRYVITIDDYGPLKCKDCGYVGSLIISEDV